MRTRHRADTVLSASQRLIRWTAPPTVVVNTAVFVIGVIDRDLVFASIGCVLAAFALLAWIYYLEDSMTNRPAGYRDIAARLRWEITEERALRPGAKLESIHKIAERLGSTRVTVARALNVLVQEGLIEIVRGRGTYVLGEDDFRSDRAKDHVERRIITVPSGQAIPHTQTLVREFDTSYATVRRVQRTLSSQGVITRQPDGTYIRS